MTRAGRLPLVVLAMLSLLSGLLAGLHRIGWSLPLTTISPSHGAIMIGGFLGTLITLEKIIPLRNALLYLIPFTSTASLFLFFMNMPAYSIVALIMASAGLSVVFFIYWFREQSLVYAIMFAGGICWLNGNILLLHSNFYPIAIPWWMAFVLLIITSERLELMRFLPVTMQQKWIFIAALAAFLIGCVLSFHGAGSYVAAFALILTSIWLMRHDVVAINLKKKALPRYVGIALLSGYFSLLICGLLLPLLSNQPLGYDAIIHSFFIGFTFSIIFAHGPIILPGVLGLTIKPYHPMLYFWLVLLHSSWIVRAIGDLALDMYIRKYSGLVSAVAIVGYLITMAAITIRSYRAQAV